MTARSNLMKEPRSFTLTKHIGGLPGRLALAILAPVAVSMVIPLLLNINQFVPFAVLKWTSIALTGVMTGFSARLLLAGRTLLLKLLTASLALLSSLVLLGFLAPGAIGASLPARHQSELNLAWLGQFLLGVSLAWLTLRAWRAAPNAQRPKAGRPPEKKRGPAAIPHQQTGRPVHPGKSPHSNTTGRSSEGKALIARPPSWQARWSRLRSKLNHWWEHGLGDPGGAIAPAKPPSTSRWFPKRKIRLRQDRKPAPVLKPNSPIHLVGEEEHRCPYCLELVHKNDPRGVKVCPICHTHHHADCWAVTGTCQVPHYHE